MSFAAVLVYIVTILVAVIVALTYLKPHLLQSQAHPDQLPPKVHLYAGAAGLVVWLLFLVSPPSFFLGGDIPGVIGLFGIWLAAIAGIYLLVRRLKEERSGAAGPGVDDVYGYDDGYGDGYDDYAEDPGYGYDGPGYDGYAPGGNLDDAPAYADPQPPVRQPVAPSDDHRPARRPEPRRAAASVEETAVMPPLERDPSPIPAPPAPPPAPSPRQAGASAAGASREGQSGRRVAGRQAPEPPSPEAPASRPRQERPRPEQSRPEQPRPERPSRPVPPPPERAAPVQPEPSAPSRGQDAPDPWGRRQEPPQRRTRGYDGRYDDRRNDSHDEFADRRYRRDSSYQDHPGQQPPPAPPRVPRPAPRSAPRPAAQPEPPPAPAPPPPPQAPRPEPGRRPAAQQPQAYDPYSLDSYGPPREQSQPRSHSQPRSQSRPRSQSQPGAHSRPRSEVQPEMPGPEAASSPRRHPDQDYYEEQAYAGYEQGYDDAYAQGYGYDRAYDQAYDQGYDQPYDQGYDPDYDDRYDDAFDRSTGGRRHVVSDRRSALLEGSGAAIVVHITLVILAIWLTWAYGTSVI